MLGASEPSGRSWRAPARPTRGWRSSSATSVGEGALADLGVGVDEEDVAGVGDLQAAVVGVAEAAVLAAQRPRLRGSAPRRSSAEPSLAVVDDDDVEVDLAAVGVEAAQRGIEPALAVVGDDDRADVMHGRVLRARTYRENGLPGAELAPDRR